MLVGYARVSTAEQTLALQEDALGAAGCGKIFTDTSSGAKAERPGLTDALAYLRPGDALAVWRLDRLGRSLPALSATLTDPEGRGIGFRSLTEQLDTTTSGGKPSSSGSSSASGRGRDWRRRGRAGGRGEGRRSRARRPRWRWPRRSTTTNATRSRRSARPSASRAPRFTAPSRSRARIRERRERRWPRTRTFPLTRDHDRAALVLSYHAVPRL